MSMIKIEHLRKEYPNVTPLKDVCAEINKGDVISVIGPSGTGKSTLLRCLNQLEEPTSGTVSIDGEVITDPKCNISLVRRKMGMVFQSFNLFANLNIVENVMSAPVNLHKVPKEQARKEAMELLKKSGAESIVPMQEFSYPPQRGLFIDENGLVKMLHPEYATTRSQDLQKQYHECGQFYIFRNDAFRVQKDTTMEKSIPYIIDPVESQDIDNESDWLLAELKYRFLTEQGILK